MRFQRSDAFPHQMQRDYSKSMAEFLDSRVAISLKRIAEFPMFLANGRVSLSSAIASSISMQIAEFSFQMQ